MYYRRCSPEGCLLDYIVQDLFTGENYGKLDTNGLLNTFDPGRFETVKMDYMEEVRLSELSPDVSYEYDNVNEPHMKIVNDSGENVLVYYDDLADHQSGRAVLCALSYIFFHTVIFYRRAADDYVTIIQN